MKRSSNVIRNTQLSLVLALLISISGEAQTGLYKNEVKVPNEFRYYKGIYKPSFKTLHMSVLIAIYWGDDSKGKKRVKRPKYEGHVEVKHVFFNKKVFENSTIRYATSYRERRILKHLYY